MSLSEGTVLLGQSGRISRLGSSVLNIATAGFLWSTVTQPPAAILGYIPLENVQNIQYGSSVNDLKYRSVGAAFLANQQGEQFETICRIDILATGLRRFLLVQVLKSLQETNRGGSKKAVSVPVPNRLRSNIRSQMNLRRPFSSIEQADSYAREGISNKIINVEYNSSYMQTFPFVTSSVFLPSVYIESVFVDEDVKRPNAFMITILLRTWKNQWKRVSYQRTGSVNVETEKMKFLRYIGRAAPLFGVAGIIWKSAENFFRTNLVAPLLRDMQAGRRPGSAILSAISFDPTTQSTAI